MVPAARLGDLIQLLDAVETAMGRRAAPMDRLVRGFFRTRRYAGSGDRRAIREAAFSLLRHRALLLWSAEEAAVPGASGPTGRALVLAALVMPEDSRPHWIDAGLFGHGPYGPDALDEDEQAALARLHQLDVSAAPEAARLGIPHWALDGLTRRFGTGLAAAMAALNSRAGLDVRLNPLKLAGLMDVMGHLPDGFEPVLFSPIGLRSATPVDLSGTKALARGWVEIQDEAAQIACLMAAPKPGMQVLDLCAGAGGKSLLMAALMAGKGQIHACDIARGRLQELKKRAARAGAHNIQPVLLNREGARRESALAHLADAMDRVVVDAPCTGTGTWRRNPDQRWRGDGDWLRAQAGRQRALLLEAARAVKPGGRLIYMTCSLLPEENEDVVADFLRQTDGAFEAMPIRGLWAEAGLGLPIPESLDPAGESSLPAGLGLQLAPHRHGTDGFFLAVLRRAPS
ncbi:RsmB/NOP family class I SAM-dependent RNA methyltransferase [Yunchengibacter salinarum]|uniref:RsmB/NOP family class I SAM-dependent RNA methyltransferase n=1 Tax=Yunchengibacter salinarum TaxID=3133399 RepID=UPI0035B6208E